MVSAVDRGGLLAAALTAVIRPVLPTSPAFYIGAPTPGSGKTLLAFCLSALAGQNAEAIPRAADEDEMRKRLFAAARQGLKAPLFDNLSGVVESDSLCAFLTSGEIRDRVLGVSNSVTAPANTLSLMTGNNVIFAGDLNRRLIRIEIDPRCERPYEREFGLNPLAHVREKRFPMVRDALTILRTAGQRAGKPRGDYGSFEEWSRIVRSAVVWVGANGWLDVADPLLSVSAGFEQDPEVKKLAAIMSAWKNAFGKKGATVPEAIRAAQAKYDDSRDLINPELFDALDEIAGERGVINSRRLGRWIERHVKRIVDGRYFASMGKRLNYNVWGVCEAQRPNEFHEIHECSGIPIRKMENDNLYIGTRKHSSNSSNSSAQDGNGAAKCLNCRQLVDGVCQTSGQAMTGIALLRECESFVMQAVH